ncbi:DUF4139 domain-containing protein [Aestuariibaculum sediminum]|uniref:Mucoidy inhibitor MuiA family protein n=1 Tax=Aestuariibaculum sediminum TaxID=2770637 RepID=A0A8J6Q0Z8_9FLAO|nr:DUF4139 domain-containing protein [Aestuariibaculum sediminum]MBD0830614.1 mucoidy inhibitor MuiA family protein [Aestuariibaculum sediminum]
MNIKFNILQFQFVLKHFILLCFLIAWNYNFAQELQEISLKSEVSAVTVFIEGAQITREKSVDLKPGITNIKFTNLSPFIKGKSVQVKATGNVTVLGVNHQQNYIDELKKSDEVIALETRAEELQDKIKIENTHLEIISEDIKFLTENRQIGGKNETLTVTDLKTTSDFYSSKLTSLRLEEIERQKTLKKLLKEANDVSDQLNSITSKKDFANGEVVIKIKANTYQKSNIALNYVVNNAGWYPSYDIRAKNISEPVQMVYKANVKQDTKVDWKNVKLKFSSANPNLSGTAPQLKTYFLDYHSAPPRYKTQINEVSGRVTDLNNTPLPGVNVNIEGTTIGTVTNFDGFYSLAIPNNSSRLQFSYIGFQTKTLPVFNSTVNVKLTEDQSQLDEVVVVGYGKENRAAAVGSIRAEKITGSNLNTVKKTIPLQQVENQTTVDFEVEIPYTINSDNKNYAVDMVNYELPANYQYYAIPKIEKEAYLVASINNWEQYNLLEGEANIFFENTFIGKTILDTRYASDTLQVSLGRDKNISINREKVTDYTSKKFIGGKKEQSRAWKISVKNNKSKTINMIVLDQVPVSIQEDIKVDILEISKGKLTPENGEVKWELEVSPNENKVLNLYYSVKFPKNQNLIIE